MHGFEWKFAQGFDADYGITLVVGRSRRGRELWMAKV